MNAKLSGNIWKLGVHYVTNKRLYQPILGISLLTVPGTTAATLGTMLLAGSMAALLFELPSGYISDKMGHKQAIVLARLAYVI